MATDLLLHLIPLQSVRYYARHNYKYLDITYAQRTGCLPHAKNVTKVILMREKIYQRYVATYITFGYVQTIEPNKNNTNRNSNRKVEKKKKKKA